MPPHRSARSPSRSKRTPWWSALGLASALALAGGLVLGDRGPHPAGAARSDSGRSDGGRSASGPPAHAVVEGRAAVSREPLAPLASAVRSGGVLDAPTGSARASGAAVSASPATHPVVRPVEAPDGSGEIAAGELLVYPTADAADLDARIRQVLPDARIDTLPLLGVRRVRLPASTELQGARDRLAALAEVGEVGFDPVVRASGFGRGGPVGRHVDWNLTAIGLDAGQRRGRRAGSSEEPSRFVVAVLDSGVADAPGLRGVERVAPWDALDGDTVPQDEHGHGTFLASLIVGDPGLAGDAALLPVRVLDGDLVGTEAALVAAIHHATHQGADVINLSLVFGPDYLPTRLLDAAITEALSLGVVIVGAAGNDGRPVVRYPAAFPGVVAVGASTPDSARRLSRAPYSAHGAALDVLAPGGDLDTDANRDGVPDGVIAESFDPRRPGVFSPWVYAGTSQAAAHATAVAVHLLRDGVDPGQVPHHLRVGAHHGALPYDRGFGPDAGAGHLWRRGASRALDPAPLVGAQALVILHEVGGLPAAAAVLSLVDAAGQPLAGARAHAHFRGGAEAQLTCVTDATGICALDAGALTSSRPIVLEILAAVLPDSRVARPTTVAPTLAVQEAREAIDGVGFGPSSILWYLDSSFGQLFFPTATHTWLLFGSGEGSALPPTAVALSESQVPFLLEQDAATGGTGFGPSSVLFYDPYWFGNWLSWTWGTGFGPSSFDWSGWTFLWWGSSQSLWGMTQHGSPLHDVTGAAFGQVSAASSGTGIR